MLLIFRGSLTQVLAYLECRAVQLHCKPLKEGQKVDWQRLMPPRGIQVLARRWVVERTFSWLDQNRRMSKDYERLCATGEAFIYAAMTRLMVRRLART